MLVFVQELGVFVGCALFGFWQPHVDMGFLSVNFGAHSLFLGEPVRCALVESFLVVESWRIICGFGILSCVLKVFYILCML